MAAMSASADGRRFRRRDRTSAATAVGPATSAHVPIALRRSNSICQRRSWAATKPWPNHASASVEASTCAIPHPSRRIVTGECTPFTTIFPSIIQASDQSAVAGNSQCVSHQAGRSQCRATSRPGHGGWSVAPYHRATGTATGVNPCPTMRTRHAIWRRVDGLARTANRDPDRRRWHGRGCRPSGRHVHGRARDPYGTDPVAWGAIDQPGRTSGRTPLDRTVRLYPPLPGVPQRRPGLLPESLPTHAGSTRHAVPEPRQRHGLTPVPRTTRRRRGDRTDARPGTQSGPAGNLAPDRTDLGADRWRHGAQRNRPEPRNRHRDRGPRTLHPGRHGTR